MEPTAQVRMDKWLWCVRLFNTRTAAATACQSGKVRINDQPVKPARHVHPGETITAVTGDITRTVKVRAPLERRVAAKLVGQYLEDLTPAAQYAKPREPDFTPVALRPKGLGRPTKKDRRRLDDFLR